MMSVEKLRRTVLHEGEVELQDKVGLDAGNRQFIQSILRPYMPDQHRIFFSNQSYLFIGSKSSNGEVWASVIFGPRAFAFSPEPTLLQLTPSILPGDPLERNLFTPGSSVGLLGIEFDSRRRNRMNGKVSSVDSTNKSLQITVDLSFGNCPKYIQARSFQIDSSITSPKNSRDWTTQNSRVEVEYAGKLRAAERQLIESADTFFVASAFGDDRSNASHGVDISHRGGRPGFISVEEQDGAATALVWPDYLGNFFFNTLGNITKNPQCGLLFIDFLHNKVVQVVGHAQIVDHVASAASLPPGAQRMVRFWVSKVRVTSNALPFSWMFISTSPYAPVTSMTGAPAGTNPRTGLIGLPLIVQEIIYETHDTATYVLGGAGIALTSSQRPGQYASFAIDPYDDEEEGDGDEMQVDRQDYQIRTWTISSAPTGPSDYTIAITVKKKSEGSISSLLFDRKIRRLTLTGISGNFHLPSTSEPPARPLLFIAGGVGITPLMSMLRGLVICCHPASLWSVHLIYSVHTRQDVIFHRELQDLASKLPQSIKVTLFLTRETKEIEGFDAAWKNFRVFVGERISHQRLKIIVSPDIKHHNIYICGPSTFMEALEQQTLIRDLGVAPTQIFSEKFDY